MTKIDSMLFAEQAYLPGGWRRDVLLRWNAAGALVDVSADAAAPAGVARANGPLLPGMPNLHSHAFQRAMAGLTEYRANPSDTFWSWRDLMYRFALKITPDALAAVARWLYVEMLKSGYTSVCEFHYVHHAPDGARYARPAELAARVVGAARDAGIGITMLPVAYQYSGFGERAPRDDQRRFINTPDALLALVDALRGELPEHGGLRYGIAPHSLRAVSESGLRALVGAMPADAPVHIHIAEQTAEVDDCMRAYGARPVRWLLERFDVNARWCLVHATHLDAAETQALARSGATAGLCPTTEANLGDGIFPAVDYLAAGGAIGIGSDSHASVDWRAELRLFEYGQRLVRRERNVLADAAQTRVADRLFAASLAGGARAAGRAVGALEAGRRADWIVLDPAHPSIAEHGGDTWLSGAVFAEHGDTPVLDVYVGGERVVNARRHRDEEAAYAGYRAALAQLLS
ncbi:formimidoylglutamate deiminase [Burkholderia pseudomallei]|uniref:formimidoylglutamate deiminase n=1 Tax=Burkholderia pseudomallei TaxID=28450 RepID=UPI000A1A1B09|nr:formimidoylglutamate deiminase [Burkholderia pseudomallei]ARK78845.1 formimidoylglutamate deiminase [Burkholderia pseudomallei]ARL04113.1 formimidoylglutamate deiminase [Burkholderia pseudomallei]ARL98519.1 formimidoylglutamate deiminase [Burkholderia pseudomallei]NRE48316.1 formimidoylglutamate deiminase [Burkholderia pseudomallei]OSP94942.1 formimidoylglutamate deiminase [Burkholderia pseudomallei]